MILLWKTVSWEGALKSVQSGGRRESMPTITSAPGKTVLENADVLCSNVSAASGVADVGLAEINFIKAWLSLGVRHHNVYVFSYCKPSIHVLLRNLLWVALAGGTAKRFEVSWENCIGNQADMISSLTQAAAPREAKKVRILIKGQMMHKRYIWQYMKQTSSQLKEKDPI